MSSIKPATYAAWAKLAEAELGGRPIEELVAEHGGLKLSPVHFAEDVPAEAATSIPGEAPFRRGIRATMYANRPWTIRQYAGFSTAAETNEFYRQALAAGQKGLSVAFDLPTHRGYDSDHPRVAGDVGKAGVAIDTVEDIKALFAGIPLDETSVSMTMNGAVIPILAMFIVAAEEVGVARGGLAGTIQNDILKEFMVRNTYIYAPAPSMRIVGDVIAFAARQMPRFNSISVSGYHMHEAGATSVQELAYTLADGIEYVRAATGRGLAIDDFAPRLSFFFGVGMDFFVEVAKLRAARVMWASIMADLGARNARSKMLRAHCQTSGVSLTEHDPLNNVTRTAYEALAAVLGGTQSLHTNSFDEAIALPSTNAARIARNTQLILQHESGIADFVDPLGGSYLVEALTAALTREAGALIEAIEDAGGMTKAIEAGTPKGEIERAAAVRQSRIDKGEAVIVGVNRFRLEEEAPLDFRTIDTAQVREAQTSRLVAVRDKRDAGACASALAGLREAAASDGPNLLEAAIPAAKARASVGEISDALADVFGRYQAKPVLVSGVFASEYADDPEFEAVRARVATHAKERGRVPSIYIAKMGQDGHDRGAHVVASAFADLGFEVVVGALFEAPAEVAERAAEAGVEAIGVSTLAAGHVTLVPELMAALRDAGSEISVFCGGVIPQRDHAMLRAAGVADIFGPGSNVIAAAGSVLDAVERRRVNR